MKITFRKLKKLESDVPITKVMDDVTFVPRKYDFVKINFPDSFNDWYEVVNVFWHSMSEIEMVVRENC